MKKYPITWMFIIVIFSIVGGITAWRYFEYVSGGIGGWQNVFFAVFVGGICIIWLSIMMISITKTNLGKKLGKLWKIEERNRDKRFKEKVKAGKEIILAVKRRIFANVSFVLGVIFVWLVVLLIPNFSQIELMILVPVSILWTIYGIFFSCFFHKKLITYRAGKFLLNHSNGELMVGVKEIKTTKPKINPKYKTHSNNKLSKLILADIEVELIDGQILVFKKADKIWNLGYKIKVIQKICGND